MQLGYSFLRCVNNRFIHRVNNPIYTEYPFSYFKNVDKNICFLSSSSAFPFKEDSLLETTLSCLWNFNAILILDSGAPKGHIFWHRWYLWPSLLVIKLITLTETKFTGSNVRGFHIFYYTRTFLSLIFMYFAEEAENIMQFESDLLELPCGVPTASSIDQARLDAEEKKKLHPSNPPI